VRVADYVRKERTSLNWEVRLREFESDYLRPDAASTPELSLVEYGATFHYTLLRRLVEVGPRAAVTIDDARISDVYRRFRVAITAADAERASRVYRGGRSADPNRLVGYMTPEAVSLYDEAGARWYNASHSDFGIGRRHRENAIVVGLAVSVGPVSETGTETFVAAAAGARFKVRPPIQKLRADAAGRNSASAARGDVRGLARGAVCETRPREELEAYTRRLREAVVRAGATPQATRGGCGVCGTARGGSAMALTARLDYAAKYDRAARKRFPSAGEMCDTLRLHLLALEEDARAPTDGMNSGLRWIYLFCDKPPSVAALMGQHDDA
jgi:hypothetical protein